MRWVKSKAFPIALISIVIGGYSLTAIHVMEARRDAQYGELLDEFTRLKTDLMTAGTESVRPATDRRRAAKEAVLQTKQSELASLRQELVEIRNQQAEFQQALDSLMVADLPDEDAYEVPELSQIEDASVADAEMTSFEDDFELEYVDPDWGASAESEIRSALAERPSEGITVSNMECRSTLCRIEVEYDDVEAKMEGTPFLPMMIISS